MKVTVKTLKGDIFTIEVQSSSTIQQVKNIIKEQKNIEPDAQKVVYKGKNTTNNETIQALGVKEGDFFVVMFAAPKKETKEKEPQKKVEQTKPAKADKNEEKKVNKQQTHSATTPEYENHINSIISMGFDRQTAVGAMTAAYNNPDRAVEYCINGIPNQTGAPPLVQDYDQQGDEDMDIEGMDAGALTTILNSPQFAQIREMVQNDPSSLPTVLNQIATSSPELYQVISQNPQLFEQLLTGQLPGQMEQQGEGGISVTNQENDAIQRLSALGFSKIQAAQAYIACDKNQELAANLLFERQAKGDIQPEGQGNEEDDNDNLFS